MEQQYKYRLIGLGVVVLSAGIIFPALFDGAGYRERHNLLTVETSTKAEKVAIIPSPQRTIIEGAKQPPAEEVQGERVKVAPPSVEIIKIAESSSEAVSEKRKEINELFPDVSPVTPVVIMPTDDSVVVAKVQPVQKEKPEESSSASEIVDKRLAQIANAITRFRDPVNLKKETPTMDQDSLAVAWTLQLGTFKDANNAKILSSKLSDAGYKVYTRESGKLTKVFVGPELQKDNLFALKTKIKSEFSMDGFIVRFTTR